MPQIISQTPQGSKEPTPRIIGTKKHVARTSKVGKEKSIGKLSTGRSYDKTKTMSALNSAGL